ncbi:receptor-type tyrosine-protein phosphatase S-like isoform X2 [Xenia sp. Carnegie-2017]|uniref:receptor-type tyrosine-protein phosphatase S-like isoform X2 n=1 Tax=Xenia sp. Carnegie-2017 TaxID=2897299 RepID=UPI001F048307|nr:receptor-type tyrosine-protein phosphatase S-like isoform X2 [Xenia sp. Carnegie-2017]
MIAYFVLQGFLISTFLLKSIKLQECSNKSLGLRDQDGLPEYYFQATSYREGLLNEGSRKKWGSINKSPSTTWCPLKKNVNNSFLEVDLLQQFSLCGVSTQGDELHGFTETFKIQLSSDRIHWHFYQNGTNKILKGNKNGADVVFFNLNVNKTVRFVRFYPMAYDKNGCLRVELYGEVKKKESCEKKALKVSSISMEPATIKSFSLNRNKTCWPVNVSNPLVKFDFGSYSVICGLQFRYDGVIRVTSDNDTFNVKTQKLSGLKFYFPKQRILTKTLTFQPNGSSNCLSWKLFGYSNEDLLDEDLGFQYGNLTFLNYFHKGNFYRDPLDAEIPPSNGRLYNPEGYRCSYKNEASFLELILVRSYFIFAFSIQEYYKSSHRNDIKINYTISYSSDYSSWKSYDKNFELKFDDIVEKRDFIKPIKARILRIHVPLSSIFGVLHCSRVELHGVSENIEQCKIQSPMGLTNDVTRAQNKIPEGSITVSSTYDEDQFGKSHVRLRSGRCWCGKDTTNNPKQWIKIAFEKLVSISGISTQRCPIAYATKFTIKYSYDDSRFFGYDNDTSPEIFQAVSSKSNKEDSIFANWFNRTITAKYIKVEIEKDHLVPCLRMELYGCRKDETPSIEHSSQATFLNRSENSSISLECQIRGQPGMIVAWEGNGVKSTSPNPQTLNTFGIVKTTMTVTYVNDQLVFHHCIKSSNNSRKFHCKLYHNCTAKYPRATILSRKTIPVIITPDIDGPFMELNKTELKVHLNERNVSIICKGKGYPLPDVTWKKKNKIIPKFQNSTVALDDLVYQETNLSEFSTKSNSYLQKTSVLFLRKKGITYDDYGNYTCEVLNKNQTSQPLQKTVEILFFPVALGNTTKKTVLQGQDVSFDCKVEGRPTPRVIWQFNNHRILTNHSVINNSLTIYSVKNTEKFEGFYSCFGKNKAGISKKLTHHLIVHAKPRILNISKTATHQINNNVTLTCDVSGDPQPTISWRIENSSHPLSSKKFQLSNSNQTLLIRNISLNDENTYICEARNKYASVERNVTINVKVYPQAEINSSSTIYLNNTNNVVIVRCKGRGYPAPTVIWYKDGIKLDTNISSGVYQTSMITKHLPVLAWISRTLYIHPDLAFSQYGNYTCKATTDDDESVKVVEIILTPQVSVHKLPNTRSVLEGTNVNFTCSANGSPQPSISWNIVNGTLQSHSTFMEAKGKLVLVLNNVTNKDEGVYQCLAHSRGSLVMKSLSLVVHVKPRIIEQFNNDDVENGTLYKLNCTAYGDPILTYSWRLDGKWKIPNSYKTERNKTLVIHPFKLENQGIYMCLVENVEGNASTIANITVFAIPQILMPLSNKTKNESSSVQFVCMGKGLPIPDVIWQKNGLVINNSTKYFIQQTGENNTRRTSILKIKNLKFMDRGVYSCTMRNRKDETVANGSLVVQVPPKASSQPFIHVNISQSAKVQCNLYGFPIPHVTWFKDRIEIKNSSRYKISTERQSELYWLSQINIKHVKRSDTGNYTCFIKNEAGIHQNYTKLYVLERPDPVNISIYNVTSKSVVLKWKENFNGNEIIRLFSLVYFINSSKMTSSKHVTFSSSTTTHQVNLLQPYSNYIFQISATNRIGESDLTSVSVDTLQDVPSEPYNITVTSKSNTSVQLSWNAPKSPNGIIVLYDVYLTNTQSMEIQHDNTTNQRFFWQMLQPYTNYSFWIYAKTSVGRGNQSKITIVQTLEGVPSEPREVFGKALDSTSIEVNWLMPAIPSGKITHYKIYYRLKTDESNHYKVMDDISGNSRSNKLTKLQIASEYVVIVQAFTLAGGGKKSNEISIKTKVGPPIIPSERPSTIKPEMDDFDATTMIAVKLPKFSERNGYIKKYKVLVAMVDSLTESDYTEIFKKRKTQPLSYNEWIEKKQKTGIVFVAFAFNGSSFDYYENFVIGRGQPFDNDVSRRKRRADERSYRNGELIPGKHYAVALRAFTDENKFSTSEVLVVATKQKSSGGLSSNNEVTIGVVVAIVAVFLFALLLVAVWFKIKKNRNHSISNPEAINDIGFRNLGHPIPVAEFKFYLESMQIGNEFDEIPKIVTNLKTDDALKSFTSLKNRYKNIFPYDFNRVCLEQSEEEGNYINASIIKGLNVPSKYIATQGPLATTTNDFWQMVWQQNVSIIVMLTGLKENAKEKCHKYWPENNEEVAFGDLKIKTTGETVLADFTIRYFEVTDYDSGQIRLVQHLHFTAWPDHGVPRYPGPLLHFYKRYRSGLTGSEPVIIHCSAGVGRTGTFIAIDYILQKLKEKTDEDPCIDVLHFVREMRGQRMFMVQTKEQYQFIHLAILEAINYPDTEISSNKIRTRTAFLREKIPGKTKTNAQDIYENLQQRLGKESSNVGLSSENQGKNRSQIIPYDFNRVCLNEISNSSNYINASYIRGYQNPLNFIVTQHPLPNTLNDFWLMILEQKSAILVALVTKEELDEFGCYWPEDGFNSYGVVNVAIDEINKNYAASGFIVRKFRLTDTRDTVGHSFIVTHFHFFDWSNSHTPTTSSVLRLLAEMEKVQRLSGNQLVTVHCSDGSGRSGSYCAIVSSIERVKLEDNIDMAMTLRNLQAQRINLIENEVQYLFCYDVISALLTSFDDQLYDNFSPSNTTENITTTLEVKL